ncbi:thioredoxin [Candidatus Marinamargulisbacteria bacterium SCGC AAA071-K20]|nr:thioredoxin [Candidatus Marinamargulisbacteria bacterium SCGC AAA071-K20]
MAVNNVTTSEFKTNVLEADKYVLVDFWAEWCGPCRMLAPTIEAVSNTFKDKLDVYKLNTDENQEIAQEFDISSIPCCILFKGGKEVHRVIGFKPQAAFEEELSPHLK